MEIQIFFNYLNLESLGNMFPWRHNDGKQASVCFTDLVALLYWRNGRAKMGKLTRG